MPTLSTFRTTELQPAARRALEKLLGRGLVEDEEINIWVSRPHAAPAGDERKHAWRRLNRHLDQMAEKATCPPEELERLVDEVADEVRHRSR
jgi:hypothetical protein